MKFVCNDRQWNEMYKLLVLHKQSGQKLELSKQLKEWCKNQRKYYCVGKLRADRREKLQAIDFCLDGVRQKQATTLWNERYADLVKYHQAHGHIRVPTEHKSKLAKWIMYQRRRRQGKAPSPISTAEIAKLDTLGFVWEFATEQDKWNSKFAELQVFWEREGHVLVNTKTSSLGHWVSRQRFFYRRDELSTERIARLNRLGFVWQVGPIAHSRDTTQQNKQFNSMVERLLAFRKEFGHVSVPSVYTVEGVSLGAWVSTQRLLYKKGKMLPDREERLKRIHFCWEIKSGDATSCPRQRKWDAMYGRLVQFTMDHGHPNVPSTCPDQALANWVMQQRKKIQQGTLLETRKTMLDDLGLKRMGELTMKKQPKKRKPRAAASLSYTEDSSSEDDDGDSSDDDGENASDDEVEDDDDSPDDHDDDSASSDDESASSGDVSLHDEDPAEDVPMADEPPPVIEMDDRVAVYLNGDKDAYFVGTVIRQKRNNKDTLLVQYDHGDSEWTHKSNLTLLTEESVTLGSRVSVWMDENYYPASVRNIDPTKNEPFFLDYDDGRNGNWIDLGKHKHKRMGSTAETL